jgi:transposase InsO family protein
VIRVDAGVSTARFCELIETPERTWRRWQAKAKAGMPVKGPWPTPAQDAIEADAIVKAKAWPAWGHRKVTALLQADGVATNEATVKRVLRRNDLLLPVNHTVVTRELAEARRAAFVVPPSRRNQVWQLDFSEYETLAQSTWRLAGCADYWAKYEFGFHVATTCNHRDAITAVEIAIDEAEAVLGERLVDDLPVDADTGEILKIKLVTDNGSAFKSSRFASFIGSTGVLEHIRTRRKSPGQNGVRERAFGSLKYEHLHRHEITDGPMIAIEAEAYRQVFNHVRPHEALGMARPAERYLAGADRTVRTAPIPTLLEPENLPTS